MKRLKKMFIPLAMVFFLLPFCPLLAFSDVIYQENFEGLSPDLTKWSITSSIHPTPTSYGLQITQDLTGNKLLGTNAAPIASGLFNYAEKVQLALDAQAGSYSIWFDLYAIYTWDGDGTGCCGPDCFDFSINGTNVLSVQPPMIVEDVIEGYKKIDPLFQYTYYGTEEEGRGYGEVVNVWANIYTFKIDFAHAGGNLAFEFWGHPDQSGQENYDSGYPDEPWALDNIKVSKTTVPEPATMILLGLGLVGLAGVRRKFQK